MSEPNGKKPTRSPALQQAIGICVALVLCALVFVFVRLQTMPGASGVEGTQALADAGMNTPAAPSESPEATHTPAPAGLRKAVVLERLTALGIHYTVQDEDLHQYLIGTTADACHDTLTLALQSGYVLGFSLQTAPISEVDVSIKDSVLQQRMKAARQEELRGQEERMQALLPALLHALSIEGYFPPATALAWSALAVDTRAGDDAVVREEAHGYAFSASCGSGGRISIAVGRV